MAIKKRLLALVGMPALSLFAAVALAAEIPIDDIDVSANGTTPKDGELKNQADRYDGRLVRRVFDEAWQLSDDTRAQLDRAFGEDGEQTLRRGASVEGTQIIDPATVPVRYTAREWGQTKVKDGTLLQASPDAVPAAGGKGIGGGFRRLAQRQTTIPDQRANGSRRRPP